MEIRADIVLLTEIDSMWGNVAAVVLTFVIEEFEELGR
jgi:hypothetical protein